MDKLSKFLKTLSEKERKSLEVVLEKLYKNETKDLDLKKLKGMDLIFRVRAGTLRIIFRRYKKDIRLLEISRRNENTYK